MSASGSEDVSNANGLTINVDFPINRALVNRRGEQVDNSKLNEK